MKLVPLVLVVLLGACTLGGNSHKERQLAEMRAQRALWQQQRLLDYQYVLRAECFCDPDYMAPRLVVVRDGRFASAVDSATGQPGLYAAAQFNPTVDSLFVLAERTIRDDDVQATVEYDAELHYPRRIATVRPRVADGDGAILASSLTR